MRKILFVTEVRNHLLVAFETSLRKIAYEVVVASAEIEVLSGALEALDGILIYAEDKLIEQTQGLQLLKDRALSGDIPLFIFGKKEDLAPLKSMLPEKLIRLEFIRPIHEHISVMAAKLDKALVQDSARKKILVVDDSGASLRSEKEWLEDKYNIFLANSAAMAIKHISLNRPDLILLDYEMPVVDGKQVLEMIRTESDFADIPVIFLTNKDDEESIARVRELKPEGYLLKSMAPAKIVREIDDFFAMQKGLL